MEQLIRDDLGAFLKKRRLLADKTREEVATEAEVSTAYIGMIENGWRVPGEQAFIKIMKAVNVETIALEGPDVQVLGDPPMVFTASNHGPRRPENSSRVYTILDWR